MTIRNYQPGLQIKYNLGHKIDNIFLSTSLNICCGCSKEPSHQDTSFEYPQHIFWLRNKKINFYGNHTILTKGLTHSTFNKPKEVSYLISHTLFALSAPCKLGTSFLPPSGSKTTIIPIITINASTQPDNTAPFTVNTTCNSQPLDLPKAQ